MSYHARSRSPRGGDAWKRSTDAFLDVINAKEKDASLFSRRRRSRSSSSRRRRERRRRSRSASSSGDDRDDRRHRHRDRGSHGEDDDVEARRTRSEWQLYEDEEAEIQRLKREIEDEKRRLNEEMQMQHNPSTTFNHSSGIGDSAPPMEPMTSAWEYQPSSNVGMQQSWEDGGLPRQPIDDQINIGQSASSSSFNSAFSSGPSPPNVANNVMSSSGVTNPSMPESSQGQMSQAFSPAPHSLSSPSANQSGRAYSLSTPVLSDSQADRLRQALATFQETPTTKTFEERQAEKKSLPALPPPPMIRSSSPDVELVDEVLAPNNYLLVTWDCNVSEGLNKSAMAQLGALSAHGQKFVTVIKDVHDYSSFPATARAAQRRLANEIGAVDLKDALESFIDFLEKGCRTVRPYFDGVALVSSTLEMITCLVKAVKETSLENRFWRCVKGFGSLSSYVSECHLQLMRRHSSSSSSSKADIDLSLYNVYQVVMQERFNPATTTCDRKAELLSVVLERLLQQVPTYNNFMKGFVYPRDSTKIDKYLNVKTEGQRIKDFEPLALFLQQELNRDVRDTSRNKIIACRYISYLVQADLVFEHMLKMYTHKGLTDLEIRVQSAFLERVRSQGTRMVDEAWKMCKIVARFYQEHGHKSAVELRKEAKQIAESIEKEEHRQRAKRQIRTVDNKEESRKEASPSSSRKRSPSESQLNLSPVTEPSSSKGLLPTPQAGLLATPALAQNSFLTPSGTLLDVATSSYLGEPLNPGQSQMAANPTDAWSASKRTRMISLAPVTSESHWMQFETPVWPPPQPNPLAQAASWWQTAAANAAAAVVGGHKAAIPMPVRKPLPGKASKQGSSSQSTSKPSSSSQSSSSSQKSGDRPLVPFVAKIVNKRSAIGIEKVEAAVKAVIESQKDLTGPRLRQLFQKDKEKNKTSRAQFRAMLTTRYKKALEAQKVDFTMIELLNALICWCGTINSGKKSKSGQSSIANANLTLLGGQNGNNSNAANCQTLVDLTSDSGKQTQPGPSSNNTQPPKASDNNASATSVVKENETKGAASKPFVINVTKQSLEMARTSLNARLGSEQAQNGNFNAAFQQRLSSLGSFGLFVDVRLRGSSDPKPNEASLLRKDLCHLMKSLVALMNYDDNKLRQKIIASPSSASMLNTLEAEIVAKLTDLMPSGLSTKALAALVTAYYKNAVKK